GQDPEGLACRRRLAWLLLQCCSRSGNRPNQELGLSRCDQQRLGTAEMTTQSSAPCFSASPLTVQVCLQFEHIKTDAAPIAVAIAMPMAAMKRNGAAIQPMTGIHIMHPPVAKRMKTQLQPPILAFEPHFGHSCVIYILSSPVGDRPLCRVDGHYPEFPLIAQ
ncbi:hypothetical protein LCGC14_2022300, partial [marine sediment metagenome]